MFAPHHLCREIVGRVVVEWRARTGRAEPEEAVIAGSRIEVASGMARCLPQFARSLFVVRAVVGGHVEIVAAAGQQHPSM